MPTIIERLRKLENGLKKLKNGIEKLKNGVVVYTEKKENTETTNDIIEMIDIIQTELGINSGQLDSLIKKYRKKTKK